MPKRGYEAGEIACTETKRQSKHTLDSDEEEDEDETNDILNEEKIEGQESTTILFDEGVEIIPFNMKEELEEDGHFDNSGNFIFKKSNENTDQWLDSVDWKTVKSKSQSGLYDKMSEEDYSADRDKMTPLEKLELYQELVTFMNEKETVLKTIKRLGESSKGTFSASQKWNKKKKQQENENDKIDPKSFVRATELADTLLQGGDFDVYQKTFKQLSDIIKITLEYSEEQALDELGRQFDDETDSQEINQEKDSTMIEDQNRNSTKIWFLKKSISDEVEGPFSTDELIKIKESLNKPDTALVRQSDLDGPFISLRRVDLNLEVS